MGLRDVLHKGLQYCRYAPAQRSPAAALNLTEYAKVRQQQEFDPDVTFAVSAALFERIYAN